MKQNVFVNAVWLEKTAPKQEYRYAVTFVLDHNVAYDTKGPASNLD